MIRLDLMDGFELISSSLVCPGSALIAAIAFYGIAVPAFVVSPSGSRSLLPGVSPSVLLSLVAHALIGFLIDQSSPGCLAQAQAVPSNLAGGSRL